MKNQQGWADLYAFRVDRRDEAPLFRQVYAQMRGAILSRALSPGSKLPSTRELAARLKVSRTAVVAAYEQLLVEGYATGKTGAGTYIAADLPEPFAGRPPKPARSSSVAAKPLVPLARKVASTVGIAEIALLGRKDESWVPLAVGDLPYGAMLAADAWLLIPGCSEGFAAGTPVAA